MSKAKYDWWPAWKEAVKRYPALKGWYDTLPRYTYILSEEDRRTYEAVKQAVEETAKKPGGRDRLKLVDLVLWQGTHTIAQAAEEVHCSLPTAQRWHHQFLLLSARHLGLPGP